MNLQKINEIRASAGLPAIEAKPGVIDAKRRQAANAAKRAQASRDLKALRGSGKKQNKLVITRETGL